MVNDFVLITKFLLYSSTKLHLIIMSQVFHLFLILFNFLECLPKLCFILFRNLLSHLFELFIKGCHLFIWLLLFRLWLLVLLLRGEVINLSISGERIMDEGYSIVRGSRVQGIVHRVLVIVSHKHETTFTRGSWVQWALVKRTEGVIVGHIKNFI